MWFLSVCLCICLSVFLSNCLSVCVMTWVCVNVMGMLWWLYFHWILLSIFFYLIWWWKSRNNVLFQTLCVCLQCNYFPKLFLLIIFNTQFYFWYYLFVFRAEFIKKIYTICNKSESCLQKMIDSNSGLFYSGSVWRWCAST